MSQQTPSQDRDTKVLSLLREDWEAGFEALFRSYYTEVCHHIYRILPDRQIVEDIAQDLFMEIWNKRESLAIETSPGAYLYRMARSRTLNYIRDNRKRIYEDESVLQKKEAEVITPPQQLYADQLSTAVTRAIDRLPARCRQVFAMSRFDDMTYKEIAETLGISIKTVENQIIKALKHLRAAIAAFQSDA